MSRNKPISNHSLNIVPFLFFSKEILFYLRYIKEHKPKQIKELGIFFFMHAFLMRYNIYSDISCDKEHCSQGWSGFIVNYFQWVIWALI